MKYTICGFSQEKMCELGMDLTEAQILRWFIDFYLTDLMVKITVDDESYAWVKYQAIIDDLPLLGIKSVRTIVRVFDHFEIIGLVKKYVLKKSTGTYTCFNINKTILQTLLSNTQKTHTPKLPSEYKSPVQKQTNTTHPTNLSSGNFEQKKNRETEKQPTGQSCPVQKPIFDNHPTDLSSAHSTNLSTHNIHLLNSSITATATSSNKNDKAISVDQQSAATISKTLIKLFGSADVFSPDFIPELTHFLSKNFAESDWQTYLCWIYEQCKNAKNVASYFYKIASKSYSIAKYQSQQKIENTEIKKTKNTICCPVCGKEHNPCIACPSCGLPVEDRNNSEEIALQKKIYALPDYKKTALKCEIADFMEKQMSSKKWFLDTKNNYQEQAKKIYAKYISA
jgi:hypothetical protein